MLRNSRVYWFLCCIKFVLNWRIYQVVTGITLPPGSDKLYSGSQDETVRVWDCQSGQVVFICISCLFSLYIFFFLYSTNINTKHSILVEIYLRFISSVITFHAKMLNAISLSIPWMMFVAKLWMMQRFLGLQSNRGWVKFFKRFQGDIRVGVILLHIRICSHITCHVFI